MAFFKDQNRHSEILTPSMSMPKFPVTTKISFVALVPVIYLNTSSCKGTQGAEHYANSVSYLSPWDLTLA